MDLESIRQQRLDREKAAAAKAEILRANRAVMSAWAKLGDRAADEWTATKKSRHEFATALVAIGSAIKEAKRLDLIDHLTADDDAGIIGMVWFHRALAGRAELIESEMNKLFDADKSLAMRAVAFLKMAAQSQAEAAMGRYAATGSMEQQKARADQPFGLLARSLDNYSGKAIDDNDANIIRVLHVAMPALLKNAQIEAHLRISKQGLSEGTVKARVRALIIAGLVARPSKGRTGATLTDAGKKIAEKLPALV